MHTRQQTRIRLQEAVDAIRDSGIGLTANQWMQKHPNFNRAIETSPFLPAINDKWFAKVEAMRIELQLRTAEWLLMLLDD